MSEDNSDKKKDLTSIIDLPQTDPVKTDGSPQFDALSPVEQVENFETLDQIGMMDHPISPEGEPVPIDQAPSNDFANVSAETSQAFDTPAFDPNAFQPMIADAPSPEQTQPSPVTDMNAVFETATAVEAPPTQFANTEFKPLDPPPPPIIPPPTIDDIRSYSEQTQETSHEYTRSFPFRLVLSGEFDPYARDKLLLFITENPIGITSADLDFQIKAGRVLIPQISEYAGIRLIQELRESGLQFKLTPVEMDSDEVAPEAEYQRYQWSASAEATPPIPEIAILPAEVIDPSIHQVMDSMQTVQFIRAEVIEFEKSEVFQELLERMLANLKAKAARRGGVALTHVKHTVTPLAVASQYEVQVTASLVVEAETERRF